MEIDNGERIRLVIPGVFAGHAGRDFTGKLSFIPNGPVRQGVYDRALLDGALVRVTVARYPTKSDPFCTVHAEALA